MKRKHFPELTDDQLRDMLYRMHITEEMSVNLMSKELSVSRTAIMDWAKRLDLPLRNTAESMIIRHEHMTAKERKQLASKAHDAVRGSKRSLDEKIRRASTVSDKAIMSKHEKTFAKALIDADIYDFIFSYPYGIFNIDFAFPLHKVAIEVDGGNWHTSPRKKAQDEKKESFLSSEGWITLRWSTSPHLVGQLPSVIAQLKNLISN